MISRPLTEKLFQMAKNTIYRYSETEFMLASGQMSHHYFNCKRITLNPVSLSLMARAIRDEVLPSAGIVDLQAVGGLTMGADPMAYSLSLSFLEQGKEVFPLIVRKEVKGHGTGKRIEGETEGIKTVLLLDDVVTTAGSSLKAADAFREAGISVTDAVCIVDREEGGREAMDREGIRLHSLFLKSDFID